LKDVAKVDNSSIDLDLGCKIISDYGQEPINFGFSYKTYQLCTLIKFSCPKVILKRVRILDGRKREI
jgi:hypothetical protein